jgi:phospholipid/cholesterol/gamma-HCH transport system substrate-binding protein
VTGLGKGTVARYNGIDVGHVYDVAIDDADPTRVIVTLQIDPKVKIHVDSVATLESQGLTGATYVEIEGGTANSPLLQAEPGQPYPVIPSKPSALQLLAQSGPALVQELKATGERVGDLFNDQNRKAIAETLEHLSATTAEIDSHAEDFGKTLASLRSSTDILNRTLQTADRALNSADHALQSVDHVADSIQTASDSANVTVQKLGHLSDDADKVVNGQAVTQFTLLMAQTRALIASVTRLSNDLEREPTKLLFGDQRQGYTPK